MLVFSLQGIFCFYRLKDINLEIISEDNEENKELNFRYTIINQLNYFFSSIIGETNHTLIHMFRLDETKIFNNYPETLTPENVELLKEYCLHKGKVLTIGELFYG